METNHPPEIVPVAVLSLDIEDRSEANFCRVFERAVAKGSEFVVVPFGFPNTHSRSLFEALAGENNIHVVAGFEENGQRIAAIFAPSGILGEYAQTHRLPDEEFQTGNELTPIVTKYGNVGLSLGSDIYFPEVHWHLARQGADFLVHLDVPRIVNDHFYSVLSPKVRAFDTHRPLLIARPTSRRVKIVHNEEMEVTGTPMSGSQVIDQNGAILASSGFSQGVAIADLRFEQRCDCPQNVPSMAQEKGLDVWKICFQDSRAKYFAPLLEKFAPRPKPEYKKRKIKVALVSHAMSVQIGYDDAKIVRLVEEACTHQPDIVVLTEMDGGCQPDKPAVAECFEKLVALTKAANSHLLIGGICPHKPNEKSDRTSHAWLWNRQGEKVFESVIMLYGQGVGQETYDTDFGRIGVRICGDVYAPELDRLFAMQDADIIFNPSMSWGASGLINTELSQVRAMDSGHYIASVHLSFSDPGQRSHIIDPTGVVVAASAYYSNSVTSAEIDLDAKAGIFIADGERTPSGDEYLAAYRSNTRHRMLTKHELFALRRPELYGAIAVD